MRHQFFIQQFDLSFLRVSRFDYLCYLRKARKYRTTLFHDMVFDIDYNYIPGIKGFFVEPIVQHFLVISRCWL